MTTGYKHIFRQATLIACLFCIPGATANAQSRQPSFTPDYGQINAVSPEKALEILNDFRSRGIDGDYYFDFQLRQRPRASSETIVTPGRMWGSRNAQGPVTRITLWPDAPDKELRLLVQNGPDSAIWSYSRNTTAAARLDTAAMFEPLAGADLTPFVLQMPFIYWSNFVYEGIKPASSNRPAYTFIMRPPPALAAAHPEIAGVRIYIETAFHAIGKFEILGPGDQVTKTMTLKETPRINGQYIPGKIELRNERTRDGTDLVVKLAAVKLDLPREIFTPENLSRPVAPPPLETLWKAP